MKVVRHLPEQLILAHAPWLFGGILIVFIMCFCTVGLALLFAGERSGLTALALGAGVPGAIFALAIKRDQAIFDALRGTVTLQRQTLWRYERQDFDLRDIQQAVLEEIAETARPVICLGEDRYPLVEAYLSGNRPRETVKLINDWLWEARRLRRRTAKS